MTCDLTSLSKVFQSYQERLIMKGCVQWNAFTVEKIMPRAMLELGTPRTVSQRLTHWTTRAPTIGNKQLLCLVP